jgi:hypothetical protein
MAETTKRTGGMKAEMALPMTSKKGIRVIAGTAGRMVEMGSAIRMAEGMTVETTARGCSSPI